MKIDNDGVSITDIIEALSALATVFLAVIAYWLSKRTYHTPYLALLRPIKSHAKERVTTVTIVNGGPNTAYNVTISTKLVSSIVWSENEISLPTKKYIASGPRDIVAGETAEYNFSGHTIDPGEPLIVKCETLSGKVIKTHWAYVLHEGNDVYYERLHFFQRVFGRRKRPD